MNSNKEYKTKYLKYKAKYLNLVNSSNLLIGGNYSYVNSFGSSGNGEGEFDKPLDLIELDNGDIAICDTENDRIQIFNSNGIFVRSFGSKGIMDGEFDKPMGITKLTNGNIAICDSFNNRVQIFNPDGTFINKFGSQGSTRGKLDDPMSLTQLNDGTIAICDTHNHRIQIFSVNGNFRRAFGSRGSEFGKFEYPRGITQLTDGTIAVSDFGNNRVQIFNLDGSFVRKFGSTGSENGEFNGPIGITQLMNSTIAICDARNHRVQILNINGMFIDKFDLIEFTENEIAYPQGITQLSNGNIAVCDSENNRVQIFKLDESETPNITHPITPIRTRNINNELQNVQNENNLDGYESDYMPFSRSTTPRDETNGRDRRNLNFPEIYPAVPNPPISPISHISPDIHNTPSGDLEEADFLDDSFQLPPPISSNNTTMSNNENNINNRTIPNSMTALNLLSQFDLYSNKNKNHEFLNQINLGNSYIHSVLKLKNGTLAMLDSKNKKINIVEINSSQNPQNPQNKTYSLNQIKTINFGFGFNPTEFAMPTDIIQFDDGKILILDSGNRQVKIFNESFDFIKQFTLNSITNGKNSQAINFTQIKKKEIDNTNINNYIDISDSSNDCVQMFDMDGNFINKFGSTGFEEGQFNYPIGITQLVDTNIAICDSKNSRVQIFNSDYEYIYQIDEINLTNLSNENDIVNFVPINLIQLNNLNLAIIDAGSNAIRFVDVDGNHIDNIYLNDNTILSDDYEITDIYQLENNDIVLFIYDKHNGKSHVEFYHTKQENLNEKVDISQVINTINYHPYKTQPPIHIYYWNLCDEKNFNYIIEIETKLIKTQEKNYKKQTNPDIQNIFKENKINIFDTLYENRKILLEPYSKPFFVFHNVLIENHRDDAIDIGGLTRTVFYELSKYLTDTNSPYFEKDDSTGLYGLKIYSGRNKNLHLAKVLFLGELFGLAIKLKQIIEINLNPILLYQLAHELSSNKISKEVITKIINEYDPKILNTTPFVCYNENLAQKHNVCLYDYDGNEINLTDLEKETNEKISSSIKLRREVNKYFIKGFRQQINIISSEINKLPLNLLDQLISGIKEINTQIFFSNLNFVNFYSDQKDILVNIIEQNVFKYGEKEYLETLLLVMTGTTKIPSIGYSARYPLRFELNETIEPKPIDIHSCFNQFIINPKLFDEYIQTQDKTNSQLNKTFDLDTLKKLTFDFSSA